MKKLFLVGSVLVALALAFIWFAVRPVYRHHKESAAVAQAREFLSRGDYRNASVCARQALLANPGNTEACLVMAQLAEIAHAPQVLDWRRRIVELAPTVQNKLMLASTALRSQKPPYPLAAQVLEELTGDATNAPGFHVVSAELALKLNRAREAEAHFETAARLDPTNALYRLNLAVLRLGSTNEALSGEARSALQGFASTTDLAPVALRWLVADGLQHRNLPDALAYSRRLVDNPRSGLDDRLEHLRILRELGDPGFEASLKSVREPARTNAASIYAVATWMLVQGLTNQAMDLLAECPPTLRDEQPVPLARVECLVAMRDWAGLERFLQQQQWGDLEFMRQAFLARTAAEQKDRLAAEARWRLAARQAGDRLGPLISLLTMASAWGGDDARADLLWRIAQRFPRERWAFRELDRMYTAAGDTRGLNKIYGALAAYDAKNWPARNNFAATSMLLGINLIKAHETARELYAQHPEEPVIASTYAWSLRLQGQNRQALEIMAKLKPDSLAAPCIALYYGLILLADGQTNQAAAYLGRAKQAALVPEEKALAAAAMKGL